jgi:hypothetical protein
MEEKQSEIRFMKCNILADQAIMLYDPTSLDHWQIANHRMLKKDHWYLKKKQMPIMTALWKTRGKVIGVG